MAGHFYPKDGEWETLEQALWANTVDELTLLAAALPGQKIVGLKGERIERMCQRMTGASLRDLWSRLTEHQQAAVAQAVHTPDASFSPTGFKISHCGVPDFGAESRWLGGIEKPSLLCLFIYGLHVPLDLRQRLLEIVPRPAVLEIPTVGEVPPKIVTIVPANARWSFLTVPSPLSGGLFDSWATAGQLSMPSGAAAKESGEQSPDLALENGDRDRMVKPWLLMKSAIPVLPIALFGIAGCGPEQYPEPDMTSVKTPRPERSFVPGPTLADGAALRVWFEANSAACVRVPVVIFAGDLGAVKLAFIGTEPAPPPADAIVLELDDSALGIHLSTRLRSLCDAESAVCVIWIEGTWGRLLPDLRGDGPAPPPWPLTVRDVGPLVEGSPPAILVAG